MVYGRSQEIATLHRIGKLDKHSVTLLAMIRIGFSYVWTNDKKLIGGLKRKGFEKIVTTEEIFKFSND
jgi:hypothetical protein